MVDRHRELTAWHQWKERCSIGRCDKDTTEILNSYGDRILRRDVRKNTMSAVSPADMHKPGLGFACFEMQALHEKQKKGVYAEKTYKEVMFLKAAKDNTLKVLRGEFKTVLRYWFQTYYTDERKGVIQFRPFPGAEKISARSLDEALPGDGLDERTLHDLIVSISTNVDETVEVQDMIKVSGTLAADLFSEMEFRNRAIVLARALGISYTTSSALMDVTGLKKSTLGYHGKKIYDERCYRHIVEQTLKKYDNAVFVDRLYDIMLMHIENFLVIPWSRSEKRCAPLLDESNGEYSAMSEGEEDGSH